MNEPITHHPRGPSKLENYDPAPDTRGCVLFLPNPQGNEKAEFGNLKHVVFNTHNYGLLGGDSRAEAEVARTIEFANETRAEYPCVYNELTLKTEKFFGTLDWLGVNEKITKGVIIDAKFGAWSVREAKRNRQGWAYVLLAFHNFPTLKKIKIIFYAAKKGTYSEYTFWRYRLPTLERRVYQIIDRAVAAEANPNKKDYTPDAVNCSFCIRLNCPARLGMLGTLVTQWTGRPVELPHLNLFEVTTPQLATLKRLSNVFKSFSVAVDAEAKRRAFDTDDIVDGYEIVEKSGTRTVVGASNITEASKVLAEQWDSLFPTLPKPWGDYILENTELSVYDLEKEIAKAAPYGKAAAAKKIIADALEKAGLVNATRVFSLQAIKE